MKNLWAASIGGALVFAAAFGIGRFIYTPALPYMGEGLGLGEAALGWIASANFAGYVVGAVWMLRLHEGKWWWLAGGVVASGLTTLVMGWTEATFWFVVWRFLGGVASAVVLIAASALVVDRLTVSGRTGLVALYFGGPGIGMVLSALMLPVVEAWGVSWEFFWWVGGVAALVSGVVGFLLIPRDEVVVEQEVGGGGVGYGVYVVAYGLFGFGYVITTTFIVAIVRDVVGSVRVEFWAWLVMGVSALFSVWVWQYVENRVGHWAFVWAAVVSAVGAAVVVVWQTALGVMLGAFLVGGTFLGLVLLALTGVRRVSGGGDAGHLFAVMTVVFSVGQIIGPAFAGVVYEALGSYVVPSLAAAGALLLAAVLVAVRYCRT